MQYKKQLKRTICFVLSFILIILPLRLKASAIAYPVMAVTTRQAQVWSLPGTEGHEADPNTTSVLLDTLPENTVLRLMAENDPRAVAIYETIGVYFGYAIAYYSLFYDIKHVLIMGRVTSGEGGVIILNKANEVLKGEFPELAEKCELHIPDEKSRRVGQSVAAASLPEIK